MSDLDSPGTGCGSRLGWILTSGGSERLLRWGLLPVRMMTGVIFFVHGAQKAFGWFGGRGFDSTMAMVEGIGFPLPAVFALLLVVAELGGGIALILGVAPRVAAFLILVVMLVALRTAHKGDSFLATHLHQMIIAACLTLMVAGGGAFSLMSGKCGKT